MGNIIKGWITSLLGLIIMVCDGIHFFGVYKFPSMGLDKPLEVGIAFVIGLILFLVPSTKLEDMLSKKANDLIEKTGK